MCENFTGSKRDEVEQPFWSYGLATTFPEELKLSYLKDI